MLRFAAVLALATSAAAINNGLGIKPQMGYNSWYDLMSTLNQSSIEATADKMVELGLVELGYNFLALDDCWASGRTKDGVLIADPKLWKGATLKSIADYAHSKGMKFGTYTDRGTKTCAGRPGAEDHEVIDAKTYASWGVDYLKEDSCNADGNHTIAYTQYGKMRDALNSTGRPIFFSLCGWNAWYAPPDPAVGYGGGKTLGNSWRIGPDDTSWPGVLTNIDINAALAPYAGPGGWNDPCLLLAETWDGKLRMTPTQTRTQFSMWAIMASPLLISANIRNMCAENLVTYKNKEVIDVNQDDLGKQGTRLVGGPLKGKSGGNAPAVTAPCAAGSKAQQWAFGTGELGEFLINSDAKVALNSDDCKKDLIAFKFGKITKSSKTCCGNGPANNLRFKLTPAGQLQMEPCDLLVGYCVAASAATGALALAKCDATAKAQKWTMEGGALKNAGNSQCLSAAAAPAPGAAKTNVWARELSTKAYATVFVNADDTSQTVSCDATCFKAMFPAHNGALAVRDLWTHTSNGTHMPAETYSVTVEPSAAIMVTFTPQ